MKGQTAANGKLARGTVFRTPEKETAAATVAQLVPPDLRDGIVRVRI